MFGQASGSEGKTRRVLPGVDAALAAGEVRLAAAVLRGLGRGADDVGRVLDWALVVTDRRVLLFTLPPGAHPMPSLVSSFPRGEVLVLDAQLSRVSPTLVLRFPGADLAWFHPPAAWREETARLVDELGRVVPYPDDPDVDRHVDRHVDRDVGTDPGVDGASERRSADDQRA